MQLARVAGIPNKQQQFTKAKAMAKAMSERQRGSVGEWKRGAAFVATATEAAAEAAAASRHVLWLSLFLYVKSASTAHAHAPRTPPH